MFKQHKRYIIWFWLIVFVGLGFLSSLISATAFGYFGRLPSFEELENPKANLATEIYSSDGVVLGSYFIQNRSNVRFDELAPNLINALVSTEDVRFREHSGIDFQGLMRVLFKTVLFGQSTGGGSTITQQLAKNLFPRADLSKLQLVIRKFKEWVIAVKLEKNYTKEEIIAMYLNTVEFGNNAFGIKSASKTFFGVAPKDLSVEQSAVLVGLLKAPSWYSPVRNYERSLKRRNVVLGQMNKYGYLVDSLFDSLLLAPIELNYKAQDHKAGLATYFREYLRVELAKTCADLKKPDGSSYNLYRDGLKIHTTIDSKMQSYAEEAVKEHLGGELQPQFFNHWEGVKNAPFSDITSKERKNILNRAMKGSKRYRILAGKECANCGRRGRYVERIEENGIEYIQCLAEDCEIKRIAPSLDTVDVVFNTPTKMKVFTWEGEKDTSMSPMDSILYYKYFLQTGVMSMDPHSGHVKAWVGGINYNHFQFDHVRQGKRQVGSTFKPFVYTLATQEGWSPCVKIPNVPITFSEEEFGLEESWTPKNSGDEFDGLVLSMKFGLANSINCMTAYVMKQFGPEAVINIARKMGITSHLDPYPALCLGTSDLSVYEMVGAYSTFANKGVWVEPIVVTKIEDNKGNVLKDFIPKRQEAMSEQTVSLMLNMLMGVVDGVYSPEAEKRIGTAVRLRFKYKFANEIAGKTGTTQNYSDGWFMGVTPNLTTGVWVGCEDRSVHFRYMKYGQGANMALPIWALYMKKVYENEELGISVEDKFERLSGKRLGIETNCANYVEEDDGNTEENFDN